MKKMISWISALLIACGMICGTAACSIGAGDTDTLSIVTTVFPLYDWTREILKGSDDVELTMLLDNGVDMHSYQPTVGDMAKIATCDMFIYIGGESDGWVKDALAAANNEDLVVINVFDVLKDSLLDEEITDGMEQEEGEEHEHESDEHVWLSLTRAETVCTYIARQLGELNADKAAIYTENAKNYNAKLSALDAKYQETVDTAAYDTLVFADRFPFRYLAEDYQLSYYAAFSGCSAETEASVETISFLAEKISQLNLPAVMIIDGSDGSIASTVIETAKGSQKILTLHSLQSVKSSDIANGVNYLSIMESNLEVLKKALN